MSKTGLKNETQVGKILVSGSLALKEKNSAGLRVFEQSNDGDGIISGKLIRPKYNITELKKSIDTNIFELIPQEAPILEDTVLRSVYNIVTQSVNDLTLQVENLSNTILDLRSKVSELEIVSESLRIEVDNEKLRAGINENQATIANSQIASTTLDLQNAIQNSINEAIERVSLSARTQALQESLAVQIRLTEQTQQEQAAANTSQGLAGFFENKQNSGWRIPANLVTNQSKGIGGMYIETYNGDKFNMINGPRVIFSNFSDTEQTFTITGAPVWINVPGPFKVPPRVEGTPGVTTVEFRWNNINGANNTQPSRNFTYTKDLIINTTSGDTLTLKVSYFKERNNRDDKWGSKYTAKADVGSDTSAQATQIRQGGR
jgi:hypothetical protein